VPYGVLLPGEERGFPWKELGTGSAGAGGAAQAVERPQPCAVPVQMVLLLLVYGDRSALQVLQGVKGGCAVMAVNTKWLKNSLLLTAAILWVKGLSWQEPSLTQRSGWSHLA